MRKGYQQTPNEMSGYKTVVTPSGEKDLPSRTDKKKDQNYRDRPRGVPSNDSYPEQARPITPKHEKRRDQNYVQEKPNSPGYQVPPESGKGPGEKSLHKDRTRTKSKPGDEYGHPYLDDGPAGVKDRRPLQGGLDEIFPSEKQHKQKGESKRYYQKDHRRNRTEDNLGAKNRYRHLKHRMDFKQDQKMRKEYPNRFKRKPGGGFQSPAERTEEWRKENPGKSAGEWGGGDFVMTRGNPSQDSETYYDRGRGYDKKRKQWDERHEPTENSYPYGFVDNNPGSAKVIPEGHGFANKSQRELKQATLRWSNLPRELRELLSKLVTTKEWKDRRQLRNTSRDIAEWFNKQGWPMTVPEWERLEKDLVIMRTAALISDIEAKCEPSLMEKSQGLQTKLRRVDARNGILTFEVEGSGSPYTVKVQTYRKGSTTSLDKLDVYVSCTCPYWQWQGPEHHAKAGDYLYGTPRGTASQPLVKDPSGVHGACKHVLAVLGRLRGTTVQQEWKKRGSRYLADNPDEDARMILGAQRVAVRYIRRMALLAQGKM